MCTLRLSDTASLAAWAADDTPVVALAGVQRTRGQMRVSLYADPKTLRKEGKAAAIQTVAPKFQDSAFGVPAPDGRVRIELVY